MPDLLQLVDADWAAAKWAQTLDLGPLASGKVFIGLPRGEQIPREFVAIHLIDAGVDSDIRGQTMPVIQFDAYGRNKKSAAAIAWRIASAVVNLVSGQRFAPGVACNGGDVTLGPLWRPNEKAEFARYLVGARFRLWQSAAVAQ
jgi:hypothetical protein